MVQQQQQQQEEEGQGRAGQGRAVCVGGTYRDVDIIKLQVLEQRLNMVMELSQLG